ncbi:hypothetical protein DL96DRAFT_662036 [Flagelloscypha sp. PMI_526]|nr:hypothetical protein DL96DRAFT_662036 [Flagelloscypha sp. PMI_526]
MRKVEVGFLQEVRACRLSPYRPLCLLLTVALIVLETNYAHACFSKRRNPITGIYYLLVANIQAALMRQMPRKTTRTFLYSGRLKEISNRPALGESIERVEFESFPKQLLDGDDHPYPVPVAANSLTLLFVFFFLRHPRWYCEAHIKR